MRCVLYTDDMIPITVVDIPQFLLERLHRREHVRLPIIETLSTAELAVNSLLDSVMRPREIPLSCVEVWSEPMIRNGKHHWVMFARNEELALKLKCAFLPGQQGAVNDLERAGREIVDALKRYFRDDED